MRRFGFTLALAAVLALFAAPPGAAQPCDRDWSPVGGVDAEVLALTEWDPDGAGPQPALIVAGGNFVHAGSVRANHIAAWNPATGEWSAFGEGINGPVLALAVLPDGQLVAGGDFTKAGTADAMRIARWDGSEWHVLRSGMDNKVRALLTLPTGELVAGGLFRSAGGWPVRNVAVWDGSDWSPLGTSDDLNQVAALCLYEGDLVVGQENGFVMRWDGAEWTRVISGTPQIMTALALTTLPSGDLIAGGSGPFGHVARWDGGQWSTLGSDVDGVARSLVTLPTGEVVVGGDFQEVNPTRANRIARWDGLDWLPLGAGVGLGAGPNDDKVFSLLATQDGALYVGGDFFTGGSHASPNIARWGCPLPPDCYADCDSSGALDFFDFLCFQNAFAAGCP
jgi:hypothetical protein